MNVFKLLLDLIPKGYMTYFGGVLMLGGAAGLFADFVGQEFGVDVLKQVTTWPDVTIAWGAVTAVFGGRRALENLKR